MNKDINFYRINTCIIFYFFTKKIEMIEFVTIYHLLEFNGFLVY